MRKAFNFYKSYLDIFNELESDAQKVCFINLLLEKQFYGVEPDLTMVDPLVKFAYISQKHSIDKQVKGFQDKTKTILSPPTVDPSQGGRQGGSAHPIVDPSVQEKGQVQEKGKEEEQINIEFNIFWDLYDKKTSREKCLKKWKALSDTDRQAIIDYIPDYKKSTPDKQFRKNPETFLNNKSWNDEIVKEDYRGQKDGFHRGYILDQKGYNRTL